VASAEKGAPVQPTKQDFQHLLNFRVTVRRFLRWSEEQAAEAGLTPTQHQLLVAVKGHQGSRPPSIRELAEYLLLQSHSTVGLVDRAEAAGMVYRSPDPDDARVARVELTSKGDALVTDLTTAHLEKLYELAAALNDLIPPQDSSEPVP
jgi:DNA-binding MarR family transcriptional regulator